MMTKLEEIARIVAIPTGCCDATEFPCPELTHECGCWNAAKKIVEALRKPTPAMLAAMKEVLDPRGMSENDEAEYGLAYNAAINVLLKEKP
jgi:hypothetical protein